MSKERKMKWSKETALAEALKYSTMQEFKKGGGGAYNFLIYRKLLNVCCSHMKRPNEIWTKKTARVEALKYDNINDFRKYSKGAYSFIKYRGYMDELCPHLDLTNIMWTKEMIHVAALKYHTRGEFQAKDRKAYFAAAHRNILDEVCSHMQPVKCGFKKDRPAILYYLSIENGTAYKIGVTNLTVEQRYYSSDLSKITVIKIIPYRNGEDALRVEQEILEEFDYARYTGDPLLQNGNTEVFNYDILGWDTKEIAQVHRV